MKTNLKQVLLLAGLSMAAPLVSAITLSPTSYDMSNGNGQATGGQFNYWDKAYSGSGNTTLDNASLAGGLGDLTNGVTTSSNWFEEGRNQSLLTDSPLRTGLATFTASGSSTTRAGSGST